MSDNVYPCPRCQGTGECEVDDKSWDQLRTCGACQGTGEERCYANPFCCPQCEGTGTYGEPGDPMAPCPQCDGEGWLRVRI